jgi:hypothetical protein
MPRHVATRVAGTLHWSRVSDHVQYLCHIRMRSLHWECLPVGVSHGRCLTPRNRRTLAATITTHHYYLYASEKQSKVKTIRPHCMQRILTLTWLSPSSSSCASTQRNPARLGQHQVRAEQ